jgi:ABC-type glycerol-3-phosphate transport system substrate-binding protein
MTKKVLTILIIICIFSLQLSVGVFAERDHMADTWVGNDALGRRLPTNEQVGDRKEEKYVGIFYFLFMNAEQGRILDHSKVFAEDGVEAVWDVLVQDGMHMWGGPYFGYYKNTDEWIYRKHAQMLVDAGIDFVFLDTTNDGGLFPHAWQILLDTWAEIREEGGMTPYVVFHCGVNAPTMKSHMPTIFKAYQNPKYNDLWFRWEGKPLILGDYTMLEQKYLDFFTLRESWAFNGWTGDGKGKWPWIAEVPQEPGRSFDGVIEQIVVCAGYHSNSSKGRSFSKEKQPLTGRLDFGFSLDDTDKGIAFDEQWKQVFKVDPKVVMITGWNEWTMGRWENAGLGQKISGTYTLTENDLMFMNNYVDCFNVEYSRDIEPMNGFHGDNYYYQMASYIRKFKGARPIPMGTGSKVINDLKDLSVWDSIGPEFYDTKNDIAHRDHPSVCGLFHYENQTGRNDIEYIKVSKEAGKTYFMIKCVDDIIVDMEGENWMNLFIDSDRYYGTGWNGYDYVINRSRDGKTMTVERFVNNDWKFEKAGTAEYALNGKTLVIEVDDSLIGLSDRDDFDFKCADNSTITGEAMEFMDLGDAAPNGRFNFRYMKEGGRIKGDGTGDATSSSSLNNTTIGVIILVSCVLVSVFGVIVAIRIMQKRNIKPKNLVVALVFVIYMSSTMFYNQSHALFSSKDLVLVVKKDISEYGNHKLQKEVINEYVEAFNKINPKIKVKVKYVNDFNGNLNDGDVLLINATTASDFMAAKKYDKTDNSSKLLDLTKYLDNTENMLEPALRLGQLDGRQYWIPVNYDRTVVYIDKSVFDMRGKGIPSKDWTYDEFKQLVHDLTFSEKGNRYTGVYLNHHQMNVWRLFAEGFGGSMYNSDAKMIELSKGKAVEGLSEMFLFLEDGYAKGLGFNTKGSDRSNSAMSIAFAFQPQRNGRYLLSDEEFRSNPATKSLVDKDNIVILPLPEFPEGRIGTTNADFCIGFAVNKSAKNKDNAARLAKFALTEQGQKILNKYYGGIPANKSTWNDDYWKKGLQGDFVENILYGIENDKRNDFFELYVETEDPYYYALRTRVFYTCYMNRDYERIQKRPSGNFKQYLERFEKDINKMIGQIT